ncbi:tRNA (N6-threonylcarbamoyladenosine(37)-N6)-methyltransferase TrmO [Psychrobacter sp. HD31]|uniref:tRNA (N6-threonylcarbamoyladenosine(37)-N6)-methyltransferase TrmO n=1 Tax=Psychrobacter sp. HD31 TaxID=3112003 RepID=UPI003DA53203
MFNSTKISVPIIGMHCSPLSQKFGIPRQPNLVSLPTFIEILPPYNTEEAFAGIDAYSHVWVTWQFHKNKHQQNFKPQVRPPRLGGNKKMGVFATRSMYRPSQLGLSVVELKGIEVKNGKLLMHIAGADMADATPIIDIKPYIKYSDSLPTARCDFAQEEPIKKTVLMSETASQQYQQLIDENYLTLQDVAYICQLIEQDPRPAYRQQEINSEFVMQYKSVDITFKMNKAFVFEIISCIAINQNI